MSDDIPVMFLGGRLDHTTRPVRASVVEPSRPACPFYLVPAIYRPDSKNPDVLPYFEPPERYELQKVAIPGFPVWWIYVLVGYDPPRGHVLHTNPN